MDKASMTLGWMVGRQIAGMLSTKRKQKYRLGSLRSKTISVEGAPPHTSTWAVKEWNNPAVSWADRIWTDGRDFFYWYSKTVQYVLNGDTWENTAFDLPYMDGDYIWTDGVNVYHSARLSNAHGHHVLNGDTWEEKVWNGFTAFNGCEVWSDGTFSYLTAWENGVRTHYVLNGNTWEKKVWNGFTDFYATRLWSDGTHIYSSDGEQQYVLNGDTWEAKVWNGLTDLTEFRGDRVWTDGTHIYFSYGEQQYVLNGDTWEEKVWNGGRPYYGWNVWSDGTNIYCSYGKDCQLVLE